MVVKIPKVALLLTSETRRDIFNQRGSYAWNIGDKSASTLTHVILFQRGTLYSHAFMICKIEAVTNTRTVWLRDHGLTKYRETNRKFLMFDAFCEYHNPEHSWGTATHGQRNPVRLIPDMSWFHINMDNLDMMPMPPAPPHEGRFKLVVDPLMRARQLVGGHFGVTADKIAFTVLP